MWLCELTRAKTHLRSRARIDHDRLRAERLLLILHRNFSSVESILQAGTNEIRLDQASRYFILRVTT